jgi:glutathione S-transferase
MLTLYYSPGACSLAPHIALEEAGATYALQLVSIPKREQQDPEYLNVNPRGKIPALRTDDGVLTENVAILTYIARTFPQARLLPEEPIGMARCISHMAWLSNTVHPAFTHIVCLITFRPEFQAPWPGQPHGQVLPISAARAIAVIDAAVLEFGPTEILPPVGAI